MTQARYEEQLAGEQPYAYAGCNPVTYVDPSGEQLAHPSKTLPSGITGCLSAKAQRVLLQKMKSTRCASAIQKLCGMTGLNALNDTVLVPSIINGDCQPGANPPWTGSCRVQLPYGPARPPFPPGTPCVPVSMCLNSNMCSGTGYFAGRSTPALQACVVLLELGNACSCANNGYALGEPGGHKLAAACGCKGIVGPGGTLPG